MSHTAPKTLSDYRKDIDSALEDSFLRRTLDTFAVAYRANREAVFKEVDERGLIKQIADAKDDACKHMEELYEQFRRVAEERGVHVHLASTGAEANRIIAKIAKENNCHNIIKSKSMTAEEIQLNPYLEKEGFIVDETDRLTALVSSVMELSKRQVIYAATDAWIGRAIYLRMRELGMTGEAA